MKEKFAKHQLGLISESIIFLDKTFDQYHLIWEYENTPDESDYERTELNISFVNAAKNLYYQCIAYLETIGQSYYRGIFEEKFSYCLTTEANIKDSYFHEDSGNSYSNFTGEVYNFLSPYRFSNKSKYPDYKYGEFTIIEHILHSTPILLETAKVVPSGELQINNVMVNIFKSVFPKAAIPTVALIDTAKHYKPDILIPDLKCAIEFKISKTEKELDKCMNQIFEDVHGYSLQNQFKEFYAVFYIENSIFSKSRFRAIWKQKKFPKNWHPIFISGKIK
jgi:hypothetical protein